MGHTADIVVFSDLDGTLLDHQDYSWGPALPALKLLHDLGAGLVLATSKTAAEVCGLRDAIGFPDWPAIVENGGGLLAGGQTDTPDAGIYLQIRAILADLPSGFHGFGDMTTTEISRLTGLPPAQAALARACSDAARPIADKRGTVEFRVHVAGVLAKRAAIIAKTRAGGAS